MATLLQTVCPFSALAAPKWGLQSKSTRARAPFCRNNLISRDSYRHVVSSKLRESARAQAEPKGSQRVEEDSSKDAPVWSKPGNEDLAPWATGQKAAAVPGAEFDLPFPVWLLGSVLVAIAAVGSIFEYANGNAIFGVVQPNSPLWAPILGWFVITGIPLAGYCLIRAIKSANALSEQADKEDGYL